MLKSFAKFSYFVLAILLVSGLLAGCHGDEASNGDTPGPGIDPDAEIGGEITVWGWNVAAAALEETAKKFMDDNPGVVIKVEDIGRTDLYDRLTVGLASNGAGLPDVIQVDERFPAFSTMFPEGFLDLTDLAGGYMNDFDPSKYPVVTVDDKILAVPWDSGPSAIFYRRDIYEQAGVNAEDIATWDDFMEAGRKIKEATNGASHILMNDIAGDDGVLRIFLNQIDNFYFDAAGDIIIHKEGAVRALTKLKEAYDEGLLLDTPSWDSIITGTVNGTLASIPFGVWYSGTIQDQAPDQAGLWGVFPLPAFDPGGNRAANLGGSNLAINSRTENPDLAWKYVEYSLATTEGQMAMMTSNGIFPSYIPAFQDPFFNSPDEFFGGQMVWDVFTGSVPNVPEINYTADFMEASTFVVNAQAQVLLEGKDPAEALMEAAEEIARVTGRTIAD